MRLPFVSREAYAQLQAAYQKECAEKMTVSARYAALQSLVMERGLQPAAPSPVSASPAVPREESPIAKKIREESGGDARLAQHFARLAHQLKAEGQREGDIVDQIGWHEDGMF